MNTSAWLLLFVDTTIYPLRTDSTPPPRRLKLRRLSLLWLLYTVQPVCLFNCHDTKTIQYWKFKSNHYLTQETHYITHEAHFLPHEAHFLTCEVHYQVHDTHFLTHHALWPSPRQHSFSYRYKGAIDGRLKNPTQFAVQCSGLNQHTLQYDKMPNFILWHCPLKQK